MELKGFNDNNGSGFYLSAKTAKQEFNKEINKKPSKSEFQSVKEKWGKAENAMHQYLDSHKGMRWTFKGKKRVNEANYNFSKLKNYFHFIKEWDDMEAFPENVSSWNDMAFSTEKDKRLDSDSTNTSAPNKGTNEKAEALSLASSETLELVGLNDNNGNELYLVCKKKIQEYNEELKKKASLSEKIAIHNKRYLAKKSIDQYIKVNKGIPLASEDKKRFEEVKQNQTQLDKYNYISFSQLAEIPENISIWNDMASIKKEDMYKYLQRKVSCTEDEKAAIRTYTSDGYIQINLFNRDPNSYKKIAAENKYTERSDQELLKLTKDLNSFIDNNAIDKDINLYRGINDSSILDKMSGKESGTFSISNKENYIGKIIQEKGFMSTSDNRHIAERFKEDSGGFLINIKAKKGDPVARLAYTAYAEKEHLFKTGSMFIIDSIDEEKRELNVHCISKCEKGIEKK